MLVYFLSINVTVPSTLIHFSYSVSFCVSATVETFSFKLAVLTLLSSGSAVSSSSFGSSAAFSSAGVSTLLYVTSITFSSLIPATLYVITFPSVFAGSNALPFTLTCAISKPSFNVIWKLNSSPSLTSFTY